MSVKAITWAWEQKLSPTEKLTLVALADCANDEGGSCYPSYKRLADKTGLTSRSLQRIVDRLEEKGLIKQHDRFLNNRQTSNNYRLFLTKKAVEGDTVSPLKKGKGRHGQQWGGDTVSLPGATRTAGGGRHVQHPDYPSVDPSDETSINLPAKAGDAHEITPHRKLCLLWSATMESETGSKGPFNGRDGKNLGELLKIATPESVEKVILWAVKTGRKNQFLAAKCDRLYKLYENWNLLSSRAVEEKVVPLAGSKYKSEAIGGNQ